MVLRNSLLILNFIYFNISDTIYSLNIITFCLYNTDPEKHARYQYSSTVIMCSYIFLFEYILNVGYKVSFQKSAHVQLVTSSLLPYLWIYKLTSSPTTFSFNALISIVHSRIPLSLIFVLTLIHPLFLWENSLWKCQQASFKCFILNSEVI